MRKLLLIGATDPNGAGLQADWRVCAQLGIATCSVVTAVTAQDHLGVSETGILSPGRLAAQLNSINWSDISAIKVGMLGNAAVIESILPYLSDNMPLIIDPVLAASSGGRLLDEAGQNLLTSALLPRADLVTPNLAEARQLTGMDANATVSVESIAAEFRRRGSQAVLITGATDDTSTGVIGDYFESAHNRGWLSGQLWPERDNVRGTGCSLATAVAAMLVKGQPMSEAVVIAKAIINGAIGAAVMDGAAWQLSRIELPTAESQLPHWTKQRPQNQPIPSFPDCGSSRLGIYPVVDSVEWIKRLVPLGVETIQLRIKTGTASQIDKQIAEATRFCNRFPVRLFINDHWQLAIKHRAYGVHLGQEDLDEADLDQIAAAGLRLGVSTHCYREMARALAIQPSYLALGPIYPTSSKQMPWIPQGVDAVQRWVSLLDHKRPLVAIGGIDLKRARDLSTTGVGSVAMISAITQSKNPDQSTRALLDLWQTARA